MPLRLDHVGLASRDVATLQELLVTHLGLTSHFSETVRRQGVRVHFFGPGETSIEVLEALGPDSPVARFLAKRTGGVHHLAFSVPNIDAAFQEAQSAGLTPLGSQPNIGAGGKRIFFLHPRDTAGILFEFCQASHPLDPVVLIGKNRCPELAEALRGRATLVTAPSVAAAGQEAQSKQLGREHWVVIGSGQEGQALHCADAFCHSLTLYAMGAPADAATGQCRVPVLVCANAGHAAQAVRLHSRIADSDLCILPTGQQDRGNAHADPELLTAVLLAHFRSAQA